MIAAGARPGRRPRLLALAALTAGFVAALAVLIGSLVGGDSETHHADRAAEDLPEAPKPKPPPPKPVDESERDRPVPILAYQVVADPPPGTTSPGRRVSKADFEAQMGWLNQNGYTGVTLQRVHDLWTRGIPLPEQPVVVSFDRGFQSVHANAFPVLRKHRWPGVLFLDPGLLGKESQGGMSRRQVGELAKAGWEIGSSTLDGRDTIKEVLGKAPNFLSYPTGTDQAMGAAEAAGYLGAATTNPGLARRDELYALSRIPIDPADGLDGFTRKLTQLPPE